MIVDEPDVYRLRPMVPAADPAAGDRRRNFEIARVATFAFVDAILSVVDLTVFTLSASNNLDSIFASLRSSGAEWCVVARCG